MRKGDRREEAYRAMDVYGRIMEGGRGDGEQLY